VTANEIASFIQAMSDHHKNGRMSEAEQLLGAVGSTNLAEPMVHRVAAGHFILKRDFSSALDALSQIKALGQSKLEDELNKAWVLRASGRLREAADQYHEHFNKTESSAQIAAITAACYFAANLPENAVPYYRLLQDTPFEGDCLSNYIDALYAAGHYDEWAQIIRNKAGLLAPDSLLRIRTSLELARFEGAFKEISNLIETIGDALAQDANEKTDDELSQLSHLALFTDRPVSVDQKIYRLRDFWFTTQQQAAVSTWFQRDETKPALGIQSQKRIGYISADFRSHVIGAMFQNVLRGHDRVSFKTYIYSLSRVEDSTTQSYIANTDVFNRCAPADDATIAAKIAADKIDILVDLSGPTAGSRPGVLARKPAPVIITHVGAAGPIGLSAVDYKLTDSICDLPENQEYLIEKLLPMDGCCYPVPKYPLPTQGLTKADLQLEGKVVIGAFYTYMKLSERCVKLWKRVLDEIPNGVLLFSPLDPKLKVAYENIMRAAEIPAAQFRFIPAGPTEAERLARYRVVDFVLDSMPYGGVNGTLEALYMGVPVVTLLGKHHSERTTTSMLTHLGVPDTVAKTPDEYIAQAKRIATDPVWREDLSSRIRARWPKFADPTDYARRWEALLRKVAR
jgi:predicted O-linked N-acetylglucosamine transferase (SPINDLY family)